MIYLTSEATVAGLMTLATLVAFTMVAILIPA